MQIKPAIALSCVALVAGCGGGGGGGGAGFATPQPFTNASSVPANGTVRAEGPTVAVQVNGSDVAQVGAPSLERGVADITTQNNDVVAVTLNSGARSTAFDTRRGDTVDVGSVGATFTDSANTRTASLLDPQAVGLEYQTFGVWVEEQTRTSGYAAAGSFGAPTPAGTMPAAGTSATYNGASLGLALTSTGGNLTTSDVQVTTDFSTATIRSTGTILDDGRIAPTLDFQGTGSVNGTGFSAPVTGIASTGFSGTANGQFYGPNAEEVGGSFGGTRGNTTYIGSFGAAR